MQAYADEDNLSLSDFKELKVLGTGGFGKVVLVQHQGKFFAQKQILKAKTSANELQLEKRIMKMSKCPFIVELCFVSWVQQFSKCVKMNSHGSYTVPCSLCFQPLMVLECPLCFKDFSKFGTIRGIQITFYISRTPLMSPRFWENFEGSSGNIRGTALYKN